MCFACVVFYGGSLYIMVFNLLSVLCVAGLSSLYDVFHRMVFNFGVQFIILCHFRILGFMFCLQMTFLPKIINMFLKFLQILFLFSFSFFTFSALTHLQAIM